MRLLFFDTKPRNPNRYIARAAFDALARHPKVEQAVFADYRDAASIARDTRFDALLAFDGEEADNPILSRLTELIGRRAVWFTEDPYEPAANRRTAALFDLVFSNDQASLAGYERPAFHLPLAADPAQCFFPVAEAPRYDVFFCGTAWPNRLEALDTLRRRLPGLRWKLELTSNPVLDAAAGDLLARFDIGRGVAIRDFCRLANQSRVTLVLPRIFSGSADRSAASDTPGPRIFEGALAGACQLVDVSTTPLAERFFAADREFAAFRTLDECATAIERLLGDDEGRRRLAESAQRATRERHLYDHRADDIVRRLDECRPAIPTTRPSAKRPKVLFVCHNLQAFGHFGGSEVYVEELRRTLSEVEPMFLARDARRAFGSRYVLLDRDLVEIAALSPAKPFDAAMLLHGEIEDFFMRSIVDNDVALVHYNHLLGFPPSLPLVGQALGVPSVMTLHDHFAVCHRFNLLDHMGRYCDIANRPEFTCDTCLASGEGLEAGSATRRRRFWREALTGVDLFLTQSGSGREIFAALFPHLVDRIVTHPLPIAAPTRLADPPQPGVGLDVALLGNFTAIKGADTALAIFAATRGRPIRYHLFGRVDADFSPRLASLGNSVIDHGPFRPGQLPDQIYGCQAALFLSTWPETFMLTLSEAMAIGLIPIVTDIGAPPERVIQGVNGFRIAVGDVPSVVAALERLLAEPEAMPALRQACLAVPPITQVGYTAWVEAHFRTLIGDHISRAPMRSSDRWPSWDELDLTLQSTEWAQRAGGGAAAAWLAESAPGHRATAGGRLGYYARRFLAVSREKGLGVGLAAARAKIAQMIGRR